MNRKTVIIILSVIGVICLCCVIITVATLTLGGRWIAQNFTTDAAKVAEIADTITDYDLPAGYGPMVAMDIQFTSMASFASADGTKTIMLFQFPQEAGMDQAQMQEMMRQIIAQQTGGSYNLNQVGTQPATIRGQPVELSILEGSGENDVRVRQVMGAFEGRNGSAFIMITGTIDDWDQNAIDSFIASMR